MQKKYGFFCTKPASFALANPFETAVVSFDIVAGQCELVFGIKVSKLSKLDGTNDFAIFSITGFNNIYGITRHSKFGSDGTEQLNVQFLSDLNDFIMAETIEEKKSIFLSHAKGYINRFLSAKKIAGTEAYQPLISYAMQQFELASKGLLDNGLKQNLIGKKLGERVQRLGVLGKYVTQLLLMTMKIEGLISSTNQGASTRETLADVLKYTDELVAPAAVNSSRESMPFAKADAIERTLGLLARATNSTRSCSV